MGFDRINKMKTPRFIYHGTFKQAARLDFGIKI